jgi:hypothetical protein
VLQHVTLETTPAQAARFGELLEAIGFEPVAVPPALADDYRWFAAAGTQVHLALTEDPMVPTIGHAAFVVAPLAPAADRLRELGFAVSDGAATGVRRGSSSPPPGVTGSS